MADKNAPLRPIDFLILLVLVEQERHGYGILQDIAALTEGELELDPGNLYRSLRRLMDAELIQKGARRAAPESNDERRRYYRLTALGRRAAAAEAKRMEGLLCLGNTRKLLSDAASS